MKSDSRVFRIDYQTIGEAVKQLFSALQEEAGHIRHQGYDILLFSFAENFFLKSFDLAV
jgi:hypothetical protein